MKRNHYLACLAFFGIVLSVVPAVAQLASVACQDGNATPRDCNGISVGAPKVFDNRTLTLMLESLSQTLRSQQQSYINQKTVLGALSNIQGFTQTESSNNFSITGNPTPATGVQTTLNTGNVDANGNPLPNTTQRQTSVSNASVTPQAPAFDTLPALQGFNPTYGSSASDLLNDQVNLTYQIFNLQMILERALSDRLLPGVTTENKTRLQAVLGFNVTIDPPRTANDAVAVVEITLTSDDNGNLSLVSLMPQEKTYNAAALSNKSNAFSGAAAVSAFQVGASSRKRSQIFYLYRDSDTVSYERMTGDPKKIVFGWMFRPVLGRRSVSPGLRQLFAIMALPNVDCTNVNSQGRDKDGNVCKANLKSKVRTYWKKYDRATLTSFEHHDANRASLFWYGLSLGLARPQIFEEHGYADEATYDPVEVRSSAEYQDELKPKVASVTWRPTGAKSIVISAQGNNFFSQTKVALGDKTYAEGSGLTLKSNQSFDLITTLDALVNGPGTVLGRYDIGVPLIRGELPSSLPANGVEVEEAFLTPAIAGERKIEIHLQGKPSNEAVTGAQEASRTLQEVNVFRLALQKQLAEPPLVLPAPRTKEERVAALTRESLSALAHSLQDIVPGNNQAASTESANVLLENARNVTRQTAQDLETAASAAEPSRPAGEDALASARTKLAQALDIATSAWNAAQRTLSESEAEITRANVLAVSHLPVATEPPILSVNGTPLDLPYEVSNTGEGERQRVVIQANLKDAIVSETGGGIVKVSWPFYPQDKWTAAYRFYNPDLAFQVTRVSDQSILINRVDGRSFINGPETVPGKTVCWELIAGDTETPLTSACPGSKPEQKQDPSKPAKKGKDKPAPPPAPLPAPSDYVVTARVGKLPDKVVLVAPNGTIYSLTVPPLKAKDDKVSPIELKQYDSEWVEIKATEVTTKAPDPDAAPSTGKKDSAPDLAKVAFVEANGKRLNYVKQEDKTATAADKNAEDKEKPKKSTPAVKSIKVEITRELTSKPGTVDIAFHGAGNELIGTRQLHITQTEWGNKGDK